MIPEAYDALDLNEQAAVCFGHVEGFELPDLLALNFVLHDVLGGGGNRYLRIDTRGKVPGWAMLELRTPSPSAYAIEDALGARATISEDSRALSAGRRFPRSFQGQAPP